MDVLAGIEALLLVVFALALWRRTRAGTPRPGRSFLLVVFALALHVVTNFFSEPILDGLRVAGDPAATLNRVTAGLIAVQVVRFLVLALALWGWLRVNRERLTRSWRGVMTLFCLVMIALFPDGAVGFSFLLAIPLIRLKWTHDVHGWGRFGLMLAFGTLTMAMVTSVGTTVSGEGLGELAMRFGGGGTITEVSGELPDPARAAMTLVHPWERAIRVAVTLLHLHIALAFLQLLVVPIRLRGLSLKRRFTVTLAMYRFIPGTLALIFMVLIVYLGIGLHRASIVQHTMDATLAESMRLVDDAMDDAARRSGAIPGNPAVAGNPAWTVIRDLRRDAPTDSTDAGPWRGDARAWSRGTPEAVLLHNTFALIPADSAIGLSEYGGVLHLRAARIRGDETRGVGVEVLVPVDSLYLARIVERIRCDARIDVSARLFIGESSVQIVSDEDDAWTDSSFTVAAPYSRDAAGDTILERELFLARNFLPIGNWLDALGGTSRVGAVQLRLSTTPRGLYESLTDDALMLTSQMFAVMLLVGIALLFFVVELSAVRTGRSIVKGIVTDVKNLTVAARKFGEGDLSHRVELSGKDEMGRLAATFNSMATNIEQHQEVLLEKERLEADLSVAREIQQRMLPQSPPSVPGLDVAGLSIPSREVGGDLFYFLPVSRGRLGLTIGDVSGKSVPAALLMSNVLAALKSEARIVDNEDQILNHLNHLIVEQVEPGRFVTFFYGVVDPAARRLRYSCAGHNPPLIVRENGDAEWLEEAGVPLGVMPDSTYAPSEVAMVPGDVLVLYSDGVTEAQRSVEEREEGSSEEFFDEQRLEAAVREVRTMSSAAVISHVMDRIRDFTEGEEQSDDLTLVVVRMSPLPAD